jgi:hypothetical protein
MGVLFEEGRRDASEEGEARVGLRIPLLLPWSVHEPTADPYAVEEVRVDRTQTAQLPLLRPLKEVPELIVKYYLGFSLERLYTPFG